MDFATAPRGELVTLIYQQQTEIEILKGRIIELEEKFKKRDGSDDNAKTQSFVFKANIKRKKRIQERKKRAHGFARKREKPTETVFHSFSHCPSCQTEELGQPTVSYTRQIIDVPQITYTVTEHVVFKRNCFQCNRMLSPHVDFSPLVVGQGRIGINLMAGIFTMREMENMTVHQIQDHIRTIYGLTLSLGEIIEILHQEASLGKNPVAKIQKKLLRGKAIYADETGGRENGINGYHWSFSNRKYQLLLYRKSRSAKVVAEVFGKEGENYTGVLVTDFYTAYNEYFGPRQRCWVHYLRDMKKLKEEYPKDKRLRRWIKQVHAVYEEAKAYPGPDPHLKIGLKEQERREKETYFKLKLKRLCEPYLKTDVPQVKLAARGIRYLSELFTFVRFEDVMPDNNMAERAVRKTVIQRKISFGTRSAKGSETKSILGSLFGTWRLQQLNPFEQMRLLLINASNQEV